MWCKQGEKRNRVGLCDFHAIFLPNRCVYVVLTSSIFLSSSIGQYSCVFAYYYVSVWGVCIVWPFSSVWRIFGSVLVACTVNVRCVFFARLGSFAILAWSTSRFFYIICTTKGRKLEKLYRLNLAECRLAAATWNKTDRIHSCSLALSPPAKVNISSSL